MNDLIRRHDAIEVLEWKWAGKSAIDAIRELPTAQPERKTGKWIEREGIYGVAYCSECGYELRMNNTNYCPNCGAEMRKDNDKTD